MSKLKSKIFGRATAIFGGQIGITVGWSDDTKCAVVSLYELVGEHSVGDKIKNPENYGEQVTLVFCKLESINALRDALDVAEACIKEGVMPENPPHGFVQDNLADHEISEPDHE